MSGLVAVGYFLFSLVFGLLCFVLWARIALRYFKVSALHPLSQTIYTLTNPVVMPFTRLMASKTTKPSPYDWPSFGVLLIVELLKFTTIGLLFLNHLLPWNLLLLYILADLIVQPCNLLFYAIIIRLIMSWVNPQSQHPIGLLLKTVTTPILALARRHIPEIAGMDFSPFITLIVLEIITLFIRASLPLHLV